MCERDMVDSITSYDDIIISFQEAGTGLPVTGKYNAELGWQLKLDDVAEEWACLVDPNHATQNVEAVRKEVRNLNLALKGVHDARKALKILRKEGHSAEII